MSASLKHRLGQLRHLDLLALALEQVPDCGDESARYYARMSKDGLISLLTRHRDAP